MHACRSTLEDPTAAAPLAAAQTDPRHSEPKDLDAVVVTANPLPRTAEDLARPVEVLTGERLDDARAASLGETVSGVAGVQSSYFGPGVGRPIVRGLDGARVQVLNDGMGSGDVSTVSVDHAVSIEPFLAEQIEILKGPATLLYGSGAIGGAVNVVDGRIPVTRTAQPLQGRAEARAGSVNDERTGMVRLDATAGDFVFHFDALHRESGDYRIPGFAELHDEHLEENQGEHEAHEDQRGSLPNSAIRTDSGAIGVSYIGSRGFIGVGASLFNTRYGVPGHVHEEHDGHDDHADEHGHGERGEHADDGVNILLDQRRHELRAGLDGLGIFETARLKLASTRYTHTEFEGDEVGTVFENRTREARLELVHQPLAGWQGALGVQWSDREFEAIGDEAFVPANQGRDTGLFWLAERGFGPLLVELGLRHDRNRIESEPQALAPARLAERSFRATSASAAFKWSFNEHVDVSFGLDRSQRAPTAEELYSNGLHVATRSYELGDDRLGVETANRAELGLHWHTDRVRLGASVYTTRFDDFIYLAAPESDAGVGERLTEGGVPVHFWVQDDARFSGVEADATVRLAEGSLGTWDLRVFGDAVRGRLAGSGRRHATRELFHGDHADTLDGVIEVGGNLPRIAPARVGGELRWAGGPLRASLGAIRTLRQDDVAVGETGTPGYTLLNANLTWHLDTRSGNALEVFLDGRNLLNEEARPHTSFLKDLAPLPARGVVLGIRGFF